MLTDALRAAVDIRIDGTGREYWLVMPCGTRVPAWAGDGVMPTLDMLVRAAERHECEACDAR